MMMIMIIIIIIIIILIIVAVHTMKTLRGGCIGLSLLILNLALYGGQLLTSCSGRFKPDKEPRCR